MMDPNVCMTVVCYNNCFGPCPYFFTLFLIITLGPGLKILYMKFVRTVDSVHVVVIRSITGF